MPFWRESAYEFLHPKFWDHMGYRERWERLLSLTPDRALDMEAIEHAYPGRNWTTLLNRIDVRSYAEHPVLIRSEQSGSVIYLTTLRPFGGLGNSPLGVTRNPSGLEWMRKLRSSA